MKIGIIGTGRLGSALGKMWAEKGHSIVFGSRDPDKAKKLATSIGSNASGGTYEETVKFGDIIILAVPWSGAKESIKIAARLIEPLAMLWIDLAYNQGMGTDIAFKLLRRRKAR